MSDAFTTLGQAGPGAPVRDLAQPLAAGKGWMKFVGVMFILQGALAAITLVGLLVAWLPIWIGVLVLQSAGAIERAQAHGDAAALKEALARLRTCFVIQGVMYLVGLVLTALYFTFFAAMVGAMLHGFLR